MYLYLCTDFIIYASVNYYYSNPPHFIYRLFPSPFSLNEQAQLMHLPTPVQSPGTVSCPSPPGCRAAFYTPLLNADIWRVRVGLF
jgi:hypothetical protein